MSKHFLFIIPLTPKAYLNESRKKLQNICFTTLIKQSYPNWKAILIGKNTENIQKDDRFLILPFEGHKEEKLQKATDYIYTNNINGDYLIRLDDDDVFNPHILQTLKEKDFDLYVDKHHSFWDLNSGLVAQKVLYWFPNTCIHKRSNAFSTFGNFPPGRYERFKKDPVLIENEHNDFNLFYGKRHKIIYSEKKDPLYLRSLSSTSITSSQASDHNAYLDQHGYWKKNDLNNFSFLSKEVNRQEEREKLAQGLPSRVKNLLSDLRALRVYNQVVLKGK